MVIFFTYVFAIFDILVDENIIISFQAMSVDEFP